MVAGLKVQVAPEVHDSVMFPANEFAEAALTTKVVDVVPIFRAVDRLLADRENSGLPVPLKDTR
jgi:hypothetical protein